WLATNRGQLFFTNNTKDWHEVHLKTRDRLSNTVRLAENGEQGVLLYHHQTLYRCDEKNAEPIYTLNSVLKNSPLVLSLQVGRHGEIWIGTGSGAIKILNNKTIVLSGDNGFTDNAVLDILQEKEDNIWLATEGTGLYRFYNSPFLRVSPNNGMNGTQVMSIAPVEDNGILFATYDKGLFVLRNGIIKPMKGEQKNI